MALILAVQNLSQLSGSVCEYKFKPLILPVQNLDAADFCELTRTPASPNARNDVIKLLVANTL